MKLTVHHEQRNSYATCESPDEMIRSPQDMLDLMAFAGEHGTNLLLLNERNFDPAFYDLTTGLAGEIAQKLSNYRVRLAVVGTFESVQSRKFREFMHESNKGDQLKFALDESAALGWLVR